jgi:hypothetical protein
MENIEDLCVSHNYTQRDILLLPLHLMLFILHTTILLLPPSHPPPPYPPLTDISNVVFQTLRFEKVRGKGTGK